MADRHPAFPMLPQAFNNAQGLMPHQQAPFQHQPGQQSDGQQVNGLAPNDGRPQLWQQIQQQQQQQLNQQHLQQFRPPQNGDGGIGQNQVTPQMLEFMRNANLPHMQAQQNQQQNQQQQQQQQQQFGMQHGQMNGGMHDLQQQPLLQNQLQNGLGGFGGNGNQAAFALQQRNLMGMFQGGNSEVTRQFDLLNASHQTGMAGHPSNMQIAAARLAASRQAGMNPMNQGQMGQNPMFGMPGGEAGGAGPIAGPSAPGGLPQGLPGGMNGQGGGAGPNQFPTLEELRGHAQRIKGTIMAMDNEIQALTNSPGMKTEAEQQRINDLRLEKQRRVPVLKKVIHAISEMQRAGVTNLTSGNFPGGNGQGPFNPSPHPPPMVAQNPHASPAWNPALPQPNNQPFLHPGMNGMGQNPLMRQNQPPLHEQPGAPGQVPQQRQLPPGMQPTPQPPQSHLSPPSANAVVPPGLGANRPPPHIENMQNMRNTPMQHPPPQAQPQMSNAPQVADTSRVPPLAREKFMNAFTNFCTQKGIKLDDRMLQINERRVDLYALHTEVRNAGGSDVATAKDLWSVIGANMGWVQFPGTQLEPARCGPAIAQNLQTVFEKYLLEFDNVYVRTFLNHNSGERQGPPGAPPGPAPGMPGGQLPSQADLQRSGLDSTKLAMLIQFADVPAEVMRQRGIPDRVIAMVEQSRPLLQQVARNASGFRAAVQARQNGQLSLQHPGQTQNGAPTMAPPFMPGQMNGQQPQPPPPGVMRPGPGQSPQMNPGQQNVGGGLDAPFIQNMPGGPRQPTPSAGPVGPPAANLQRLPPQVLQNALNHVTSARNTLRHSTDFQRMGQHHIPDEQRLEFNVAFQELQGLCSNLEANLAFYAAFNGQPDTIRRMCMILETTAAQKRMLLANDKKYILALPTVRQLSHQARLFIERTRQSITTPRNGGMPAQLNQGSPPPPPPGLGVPVPPAGRPLSGPTPPPQSMIPPGVMGRQLPLQPPPPGRIQRKNGMVPGSLPSPPPGPQAGPSNMPHGAPQSIAQGPPAPMIPGPATPQNAAQTPTAAASSPAGAQSSPKVKATPKPKAASVNRRKPSVTSVKGAAAAPTPESAPAPPAAAAPMAPHPQTTTPQGTKRPREDDAVPPVEAPADVPSPNKRMKTEWEGPPNPEVLKRQAEVEAVKTEEDATAFLEKMQEELMKMGDGADAAAGVQDELAEILRGLSAPEFAGDASSSLLDPVGGRSSPPPTSAVDDTLGAFFDFSSFGPADDDMGGASTPELVPSSTNPSPESGSEADHGQTPKMQPAPKVGDSKAPAPPPVVDDTSDDFLRLGSWGEIDGGESSYWQSMDGWKWSGTMPQADWAILQS